MKKKNILLAAMILLASSSQAQTEVLQGIMQGKDYGVTYMLPKTEIELVIHTTKHTYTPGEFHKYAGQYLRLQNISPESNSYWTIDKVETHIVGIPNKEQTYFVKLKDKTTAPLMELTEDGIICSINMPLREKEISKKPSITKEKSIELNPQSFMTEEMLMATSTAKTAELVAKEIFEVRESRNALLRGEADNTPKDGEQLKLMLDNLNLQEQAMVEMFVGKNTTENHTTTLRITPKEMDKEVAFRFSKKLGIVDKNNLVGEPVYISIANLHTLEQAEAETTEETKKKEKELEGIAYNVPGRAHIIIENEEGKKYYDDEQPLSQFGTLEYLAPVLFNKNTVTKVLFNSETGALLKIEREEKK